MTEVERDLVAYYDAEGVERAERSLAPGRVEARTAFLAKHARPGMRSLEIGSGPGRDAEAFLAAGLHAVAVDLSPVFASLAASTGADALTATARLLPFREESFDVVWSMSVLMHVPDDDIADALDEIARVLRPGALACIGVWGGDGTSRILDGAHGPRFFANRTKDTWSQLLGRIGTVETYDLWDPEADLFTYHWAVIRRTL